MMIGILRSNPDRIPQMFKTDEPTANIRSVCGLHRESTRQPCQCSEELGSTPHAPRGKFTSEDHDGGYIAHDIG
jgi:hypothetical protein